MAVPAAGPSGGFRPPRPSGRSAPRRWHQALTEPAPAPSDKGPAYYIYRTCFAIGRGSPRPVAALLARAAGAFTASAQADRREVIARNLERALGRPLVGAERQRMVRAAFDSYARYWMESTRATGTSALSLEARMSIEGLEHIDAALAAGRGAIIALPHLGSWDYGGAWIASIGYPLTVVAEEVKPKALFDWFVEMRAALGLEVVPLGPQAGPAVGRALRENRLVALLSDRDLAGNGTEVEFFGGRTRLPAGPATLALRTGAALLPTAIYLRPRGRSHAVVRPPLAVERSNEGLRADVARITQQLAHALEDLIRAAPEQWHMFQPNWIGDPGYGASALPTSAPGPAGAESTREPSGRQPGRALRRVRIRLRSLDD